MSSGNRSALVCATCNRALGSVRHHTHGLLASYVECEWCYDGTERPPEPELLTDSFVPVSPDGDTLVGIVDKLCGPVWVSRA